MRVVSRGQISFDVDHSSSAEMSILLREMVADFLTSELKQELIIKIANTIMENWTSDNLAQQVAGYIDHGQVSDYVRRNVIVDLLADQRFNTRLMRHIGDATIGVTNEAVERVSAIIKSQSTTNSDV